MHCLISLVLQKKQNKRQTVYVCIQLNIEGRHIFTIDLGGMVFNYVYNKEQSLNDIY